MLTKKEQFLLYLEDIEPEELGQKLDEAISCLNFSEEEPRLQDVEAAIRFGSELLTKQGGKLILIMGSDVEYLPKAPESDPAKRSYFYATDLNFSRLAADMHKTLTATDLYLFGHKKSKNLGSLGELIRLAGGDLCYYESTTPAERSIISNEIL